MTNNVALTIGSFVFYIVLMFTYLGKKVNRNFRANLYLTLLIICGLFSLTELLGYYLCISKYSDLIVRIVWRIHWNICNLGFYVLYLYTLYLGNKLENKKIKEVIGYNTVTRLLTIYLIAEVLLDIFVFDYTGISINDINFSYFPSRIFCGVMSLAYVILVLKTRKNLTKAEQTGIIVASIMYVIFMTLQVLVPYYSFISCGYMVVVFSLYFNAENPDIRLIDIKKEEKDKINESISSKTIYLHNMTDEIKVPTTLINSISKELKVTNFDNKDTINKLSKEIISNGNELLDVVSNILNMSNINEVNNLNNTNYDFKKLITKLIDISIKKVGSKQIKINYIIDENISSILYGDVNKIEHIIQNILSNAIENTSVGKVTISITSTKNNNIEEILFKVSDTGIGIKESEKQNLFNNTDKKALGLSIVKRYVEAMNGKIWFESEYQVGSTFYVQLTQNIIDNTPIGKITNIGENNNEINYIDCSNYKVLIVEDSKINAKVTKSYLDKYKFNVDIASTGDECLYKIKSEIHYDLILMDYFISDFNGIELFASLKELDGYKLPPTIMITSNAKENLKEESIKNGFSDYLSKPIDKKELDRIIKKYFNQ